MGYHSILSQPFKMLLYLINLFIYIMYLFSVHESFVCLCSCASVADLMARSDSHLPEIYQISVLRRNSRK